MLTNPTSHSATGLRDYPRLTIRFLPQAPAYLRNVATDGECLPEAIELSRRATAGACVPMRSATCAWDRPASCRALSKTSSSANSSRSRRSTSAATPGRFITRSINFSCELILSRVHFKLTNAKRLFFAFNLPQVISRLVTKPAFCAFAKNYLKPNSHFRCNARFGVNNLRQCFSRDFKQLGCISNGQIQRFQPYFFQNCARVRGVIHFHKELLLLVIVQIVDHIHITRIKAKNNAPIGLYSNSPMTRQISFKRMQIQRWVIYVIYNSGLIKQSQQYTQAFCMDSFNTCFAACLKKLFQAFVDERFNHIDCVTYKVTIMRYRIKLCNTQFSFKFPLLTRATTSSYALSVTEKNVIGLGRLSMLGANEAAPFCNAAFLLHVMFRPMDGSCGKPSGLRSPNTLSTNLHDSIRPLGRGLVVLKPSVRKTIMTTHAPIVFNFNSNEVRTCLINDQPWFVAKDVCEALGINTEQTRRLDQDERGLYLTQTPSGGQQMVIINESGLYALVLRSRKPEARKFAKWVTSEVLPSIRKTGGYQSSEPTEGRLTPAEYEELLAKRGKVIVDKPTSIQAAKQLEHDWMQTPLVGTSAILIRLIEGNKHGAIELVPNGSTIVDIRDPKSVAQFINSACALPEVYEAIYKEITIRTNAYVGRMVKTQSKSWEPTQQIEQSKGAGL